VLARVLWNATWMVLIIAGNYAFFSFCLQVFDAWHAHVKRGWLQNGSPFVANVELFMTFCRRILAWRVYRYAANHVGREATDQVPAAQLPESGRGRTSSLQPVRYDQSPLRAPADPDTRDGREKSSSHYQRLESICELELLSASQCRPCLRRASFLGSLHDAARYALGRRRLISIDSRQTPLLFDICRRVVYRLSTGQTDRRTDGRTDTAPLRRRSPLETGSVS